MTFQTINNVPVNSNGVATTTITPPEGSEGNYTIIARYNQNNTYNETTATANLTITTPVPTVIINTYTTTTSNNTVSNQMFQGDNCYLNVEVTDSNGTPINDEQVGINIRPVGTANYTEYGRTLVNGAVKLKLLQPVGNYEYYVRYNSIVSEVKTFTIIKYIITTYTDPDPIIGGVGGKLYVTVTNKDETPVSTVENDVLIHINGINYGRSTWGTGTANMSIRFPVGIYEYTIEYTDADGYKQTYTDSLEIH